MNILIEYADVIDKSRLFLEYVLCKSSHFACQYYLSLGGSFNKKVRYPESYYYVLLPDLYNEIKNGDSCFGNHGPSKYESVGVYYSTIKVKKFILDQNNKYPLLLENEDETPEDFYFFKNSEIWIIIYHEDQIMHMFNCDKDDLAFLDKNNIEYWVEDFYIDVKLPKKMKDK